MLILGSHGVATVAAAGVLLTATGTAGALCFAAWAAADWLAREGRQTRRVPRYAGNRARVPAPAASGRPGPGDPSAACLRDPAAPVAGSGVRLT